MLCGMEDNLLLVDIFGLGIFGIGMFDLGMDIGGFIVLFLFFFVFCNFFL